MNEFEWLKQTRALKQPVAPQTDLWKGIAARIEQPVPAASARQTRLLPWAMAASLAAISLLAGTLAWRQQVLPTPQLATRTPIRTTTPWKPDDPRLTGAAIELNIARQQLARAIKRAPGDTYLQHMLAHTKQQITRLQQLERRAG